MTRSKEKSLELSVSSLTQNWPAYTNMASYQKTTEYTIYMLPLELKKALELLVEEYKKQVPPAKHVSMEDIAIQCLAYGLDVFRMQHLPRPLIYQPKVVLAQ